MSKTDWGCLGAFILGFLFFLIGANYYNAVVGSIGIFLSIGSIMAYLIIYIYKQVTKPAQPESEPQPEAQPQNP